MPLTQDQIIKAGTDLYQAEIDQVQVPVLTVQYPDMSLEEAYAIQDVLMAKKMAAGDPQIGWKIGLTSRAMQMALNIITPDSGLILKSMHFAHGSTIPKGTFIEPRIEAEIAFVMKGEVSGPDVTREQVIAATDYVAPSLEILDTRVQRRDPATGQLRKVQDSIADNAANSGLVLGPQKHAFDAFDLRWVGCITLLNGMPEETGLGAGVMNDPVMGIVWLVKRLATLGQGLKPGQVVLSGSFIRPIEAVPGSEFHADFGDFGEVSLAFE